MFCKILSTYRKSCGYSQDEIAKYLHITRQAYSLYETGKCEPNIDTLRRLCILFDCTADELLEIDTPLARKSVQISDSFNNSTNISVKIK